MFFYLFIIFFAHFCSIPNASTLSLPVHIYRLETPEPWGDSQTYEITTKDKSGNFITTVFNKNGEALYFYINKKASKRNGSSKGRNSKLRKRKNQN
ncbi:hypothetical protein C922_04415 [Plasmodium inui San Antonio 1]|uniref:Uncharacterized protein n=1 Tax=Plasmodium inui San Antonio 1 TaxID=1237626 RepID=W7AJ16_9APIC|nr:hypothetical protein C922_04415 [Plasmodium inui San Antonio 1]EUD65286.1 hypothetical protein C922_04415 [Plasmodium inui San Antonio 1]